MSDIKFADRQRQHDLDSRKRQLLTYAVTGIPLEGAPSVLWRIQPISFGHQEVLRQDFLGSCPVAGIVVRAEMVSPYHTIVCGELLAALTVYREIRLSVTESGYSWKDAEAFFGNDESVGELIEEWRL